MKKTNGHYALLLVMNKENFRSYIKVRTALKVEPKTIYDELYSVYTDQATSNSTVAKWSEWFHD